jgi:hypothetical protein
MSNMNYTKTTEPGSLSEWMGYSGKAGLPGISETEADDIILLIS